MQHTNGSLFIAIILHHRLFIRWFVTFHLFIKLIYRASCSPSQGPCCTNVCTLKLGDKCRDDNGCRDPSYCDGNAPQCPPSVNKPNKTICNNEFVCYMGVSNLYFIQDYTDTENSCGFCTNISYSVTCVSLHNLH